MNTILVTAGTCWKVIFASAKTAERLRNALVAEYDTIRALASGEHWERVFRDAGLDDTKFARAKESDDLNLKLVQLRVAEVRGFDVRDDQSTLVNTRSTTPTTLRQP